MNKRKKRIHRRREKNRTRRTTIQRKESGRLYATPNEDNLLAVDKTFGGLHPTLIKPQSQTILGDIQAKRTNFVPNDPLNPFEINGWKITANRLTNHKEWASNAFAVLGMIASLKGKPKRWRKKSQMRAKTWKNPQNAVDAPLFHRPSLDQSMR